MKRSEFWFRLCVTLVVCGILVPVLFPFFASAIRADPTDDLAGFSYGLCGMAVAVIVGLLFLIWGINR